jgi:hypothetical protein
VDAISGAWRGLSQPCYFLLEFGVAGTNLATTPTLMECQIGIRSSGASARMTMAIEAMQKLK